MIVTINTDASFSRKLKIGSYAFWIVCDEFRIKKSGVLKDQVKRPEEAEFKCVINALFELFNKQTSRPVSKIIVNTDCLNVICCVANDEKSIAKYKLSKLMPLAHTLKKLHAKSNLKNICIELRHVKAHTNNPDARSYVNNWCDTAAKNELHKILQYEKISNA